MMKLTLQKSYDKVKVSLLFQILLVSIAFTGEALVTQSVLNLSFFFQFLILVVAYNFYFNAFKNLYYSFWNMSLLFGIYYMISMTRNFLVIGHPFIGVLYFLSLCLLAISSYVISSPLYYPRFHWWEYDFRFRADIRCMVEVNGGQYRGRLSDLRRGAACLELFQPMNVGQSIQIHLDILGQNFTLFAEVRSRREPIIGRSIVYGVKFVRGDLEHKQRLKLLTNHWKESKKIKIRNKFSHTA